MELLPQLVVAGRFRLIRELGRGGMASVWVAHHETLDVPCAVKFIESTGDRGDLEARFAREAKAAALLRSSNVVQILDHGVWEGIPYIVMELLEGEDLHERIVRTGRLSSVETVHILSQVARALTKAHSLGIIHRDLKPENIFLAKEVDREVVKVLDFGIAKGALLGGSMTKTRAGALMGSPAYMSPEQADGSKPIDHRSDLWTLGVLAYECLTAKLPFGSVGLGDLFAQIMYQPLPVPSQEVSFLPAEFDAWWARAMSRDAAERYPSAREMVDALARSLGVSVMEEAPGRFDSTGDFSRAQLVPAALRAAAPTLTMSGQSRPQEIAVPPRRRGVGVVLGVAGGVLLAGTLAFVGLRGRTHTAAAAPGETKAVTLSSAAPDPPASAAPAISTTVTAAPAASDPAPAASAVDPAASAAPPLPSASGHLPGRPASWGKPRRPRHDPGF